MVLNEVQGQPKHSKVSWGKRAGSGSGTVIPEIVALVCGSGMSSVVKYVLSHVIFKDDHE